jgi:glycosyltransferase involved in cell wall biosynthesis
VALGMPAYQRPDALPRTLESLLSQTYQDFALVVIEDGASPETAAIVESYAREDPRIHYEANGVRLGMVGNWRKVFERSRQLYPGCEYFAWVSDHDVWHARWLQEMVAVLDVDRNVVLAYPENLRMLTLRAKMARPGFDTTGVTKRADRLRESARHMPAGDVIYGLMRANALAAAGVFRRVITPDRQVLLALSLFGQMKQVPEVLWYRELVRAFDRDRQRAVFFPDGAPFYINFPSHLQHSATLLWDFGVRGNGRPAFGRLAGIRYAVMQLWYSTVRHLFYQRFDRRSRLQKSSSEIDPDSR